MEKKTEIKKVSLTFHEKLGRWVVLTRDHGMVWWSRIVYQNYILNGEEIPKGVIIHHCDGDKTNDVPENLKETTRGRHQPVHREGSTHSEETKKKIGDGNRGKERSWKTLEKLSKSHRGLKRSEESIEKQRASMTGRKNSPEHVEKVRQANLGKKRTPEQIERNRQARWGDKKDEDKKENQVL